MITNFTAWRPCETFEFMRNIFNVGKISAKIISSEGKVALHPMDGA
jgi:hypothetical protein